MPPSRVPGAFRATLLLVAALHAPVLASCLDSHDLLFSSTDDRSRARAVHGASLPDDAYVFLEDLPGVRSAVFFMDGRSAQVETAPPFDLIGTAEDGRALPLRVADLRPGYHSIRAEVEWVTGQTVTTHATFYNDPETTTSDEVALVEAYPAQPSEDVSSRFEVRVNGRPVPVLVHAGLSYAHLSFAGPVEVEVRVREPFGHFELSPASLEIPVAREDGALTFTLDSPRYLALHGFNFDEELLLLADPIEEPVELCEGRTRSVLDHGADATGEADVSEALQEAVDALPDGGTVLVPAGTYRLDHPVHLRDDVRLYLAGGALLRAGDVSEQIGLIELAQGRGMSVEGRGVIDGNGLDLRPRYGLNDSVSLIRLTDCEACSVKGVVLRNSAKSHLDVKGSRNVVIRDVKVVTDIPYENADGIHIGDGSNHALVERVFVHTTDDTLTVGYRSDIEDVTIRHAVLWNALSGALFKTITRATLDHVRDVTVENVDGIRTPRVLHLQPEDGGVLDGYYFKGLRVEHVRTHVLEMHNNPPPDREHSGRWGVLDGVHVHGLEVLGPTPVPSWVHSNDDEHPFRDVTFGDVTIDGRAHARPESWLDVRDHVEVRPGPTEVPVVGVALTQVAPGGPPAFELFRQGPVDAPLEVGIAVGGSAERGVDYREVPATVTFPAGARSVTVELVPLGGSDRPESVELTLTGSGHNLDYRVGPEGYAVTLVNGAAVLHDAGADPVP